MGNEVLELDWGGSAQMAGVSLRIKKGVVHAALTDREEASETLTRMLTGLLPLRRGELTVNGEPVVFRSPRDALALGIGAVYRRGGLASEMTLLDQLRLTPGVPAGKKQALAMAEKLATTYGLQTEWEIPAAEMAEGDRFRGELLRLLLEDAELLIVEEPAARLTSLEMEALGNLLRRLAQEGKTVLLITCREDTAALAQETTVLGVREDALPPLNQMPIAPGSVVLEARNITVAGKKRGRDELRAVSLEARAGEITAVVGMPGSGQQALAAALTGLTPLMQGRIRLNSKEITATTARERMQVGMAFAPGPEMHFGFLPGAGAAENMTLRRYRDAAFREMGFLRKGEMRRHADALVDWEEFPEARSWADLTPAQLQRCVLARELERNPDILIVLNPTAGMTWREARDIHNRLMAHRNSRRAVLLITEDPREAFEMADRMVVLRQGETVGEFEPDQTSLQELGLYMTGERWKGREEPFDEE